MNKSSLRKEFLEKRMAFSKTEEFYLASEKICANIESFLLKYNGKLVGGYFPVKGEVDLTYLLNKTKTIAFPRLIFIKNNSEIEYAKASSSLELVSSKLNFKEPARTAPLCFPDIILVPGICYDIQHNRLGYGKGHFDKFIAKAKKSGYQPIKVGVCFDFQLQEKIPADQHDQAMDIIITESRII